jgi:hypothetical protein
VLHAGVYLVVNGFFTVTWLLAPRVDEQFWPAWIMLLLAVPLACTPPPWWTCGHHEHRPIQPAAEKPPPTARSSSTTLEAQR